MDFSPRTGFVSLIADIERLIVDEGKAVVLVLFDGLGVQFLDERAPLLASHLETTLQAPFPSTTTVSLATAVTGLEPASHGVIGHLLHWPEVGRVINMLKFVDLTGAPVSIDNEGVLPSPNLWERLSAARAGAVTVQPADFAGTPLTRTLYRGCRFVGAHSVDEFVERTVEEASRPRTLIFTYLPPVDYAAHVFGPQSTQVADALSWVSNVWEGIARQLPNGVVLFGTADHGIMPIGPEGKLLIREERYRPLEFWGDPRVVMVRGSMRLTRELAAQTGARLLELSEFRSWLGNGVPHRQLESRLPDAALLAAPGTVILPWGFDKRLFGYHGGIDPIEVDIPLLTRR
ncbi:MAG: alkaline phosphatase family protein [Actinobacteria bacterium]|nr:alkaline phosphatase family protein [Actinomycetota bacterium]